MLNYEYRSRSIHWNLIAHKHFQNFLDFTRVSKNVCISLIKYYLNEQLYWNFKYVCYVPRILEFISGSFIP